MSTKLNVVPCEVLPNNPDVNSVYRLIPNNLDEEYYKARTDRNIGWITESEQNILRNSTVGIAGCGGMGGLLAQILVRLGIGEIRIADCEDFDASNINRQFGATRKTVGMSKAITTARMLRGTSDDNTLVVYPQGIVEETVEEFVTGCDVICDEIEFWAAGSRILLHEHARSFGVSVFNCNTVGFGTRLFLFKPQGFTMESCLKLTYPEARELQEKVQASTATKAEVRSIMEKVLDGLILRVPRYTKKNTVYDDKKTVLERLFVEGKASIISTNPPMATGFLADHVLFYLLRKSGAKRNVVSPPKAPGYLYFDAAKMKAKVVQ